MIPDLSHTIDEIGQVGLVVEDLQQAMNQFSGVLGLEPWAVYELEPPVLNETTYRGEDVEYGMHAAVGSAGETVVELIEPTMGPNIYDDHLSAHGEGLHHIKADWNADTTRAAVEAFTDAGIEVLQHGVHPGGEFWYFDTADVLPGVIFEMSVVTDDIDSHADRRYPE